MSYKSEDIKKINSNALLHTLLHHKSATMSELVKESGLSQSSVRSILRNLESKGYLVLQTMDQSSGGRCPGRYTFSESFFRVLSVFVDEGTVEIVIKDALENILLKEHICCDLNEELEALLIEYVDRYAICCVCIASSGVVQGDCFYNDNGEYMEKHEIALNLKKVLRIPIIIENDVKCMMIGVQSKQQKEDLAYIYFSHTGVGSAYCLKNQIIQGQQSFAGEIGLLPYQKQTINEVLADHPSQAVLEDLYVLIFTTIAVTIDPSKMVIAVKDVRSLNLDLIKERMQTLLSKRYLMNMEKSLQPLQDALDGLHYLGMTKLFDQYTNYERK